LEPMSPVPPMTMILVMMNLPRVLSSAVGRRRAQSEGYRVVGSAIASPKRSYRHALTGRWGRGSL
jgi:hypothetical protein